MRVLIDTRNMDFLAVLPNLSIGVVAVLALVYVTIQFLRQLKEQRSEHMAELKEREMAIRELEREVRTTISSQLADSTRQHAETTRVMERVITYLDRKL